ncbi:MAG: proprotein convertase P-domain-containing protein [Saprospiraceae bacterium]
MSAALILMLQQATGQDCACVNCPQNLPDGQTEYFFVTVENASNPILGQNGQGLCGIRVNFNHAFLGDIIIELTSPSGQSILLVGPVGYFGSTSETVWNVTFVPCSESASPDPGRSAIWSNAQNWGMFGNYVGSYHPFSGCLEDFNGTPVNGVWTVSVTDFQPVDEGEFLDFELFFCDAAGLSCFVCEAEAGNLLQNDIVWCEGSQVLNLDLPPTYPQGVNPAPANRYDYAYVISDAQSGVVLDILSTPDLSVYPPGVYSICGLSYLKSHIGRLPQPDSVFTIDDLRDTLSVFPPLFCGDLTTNCVQITIQNPVLIFESAVICAPECYEFYGESFCQSGVYVRQTTVGECDIEATLNLTVLPIVQTALSETRCVGECATSPGFETICAPGSYLRNLKTWQNCDSVVSLEFAWLTPVAQIQDHGPWDCTGDTLILDGGGSSAGPNISYQWIGLNGGSIGGASNEIRAEAILAGDYLLRVCQSAVAVTCCDTAYTVVSASGTPPPPPANLLVPQLICSGQDVSLTAISGGNTDSFIWEAPPGSQFTGSPDSASITLRLTVGGQVCVRAVNSCGVSPPFCASLNIAQTPVADAGGDVQTCESELILFAGAGVGQGVGMWEVLSVSPGGDLLLDNPGGPVTGAYANIPGAYRLIWRKDNFGCIGADTMTLTVWEKPQWSDPVFACDSANEFYNAQLQVTGGLMPYIVNGMDVNGAVYQSPWLPNGQSYSLFLSDANGCAADSVPLINHVCLCSSHAGALSGDTIRACAGETVSPFSLIAPTVDGNDVVSYALCDAPVFSPSAVLVHIAGDQFAYQPPLQTGVVYFLFRLVGNTAGAGLVDLDDRCFAHSNPQPLIFLENPAPQILPSQPVCGLNDTLQVASDFQGAWSLVAGPGSLDIDFPASPVAQAVASAPGVYTLSWTAVNGQCVASDTAEFTFWPQPEAVGLQINCDAVSETYTLDVAIQGVGPFVVNGMSGVVSGNTFVSAPVASGFPWFYQIADANGCVSEWASGVHVCPCLTDAGQMSQIPLVFCQGDDAVVASALNSALDPNDALVYVLHDQPGPGLGNVLAVSASPVFAYSPDYALGVIYYVSAVAGSAAGGTAPNFSDPCLSVSAGAPVSWRPLPSAQITGPSSACAGQALTLRFEAAGEYPVWVQYQGPSGIENVILTDSLPKEVSVQLFSNAAYALILAVDGNGLGCVAELDQMLNIEVFDIYDPGMPLQTVFSFCEKTDTSLALLSLLDQADPGGRWRQSSGNPPISPGAFDPQLGALQVKQLTPGLYGFGYFFEAAGPCPERSTAIMLRIEAAPSVDAGQDRYLDCQTNLATLNVTASSPGLTYAWYLDGVLVGAQPALQTSQAGLYTLVGRSAAGCEARDSVRVISDYALPQAQALVRPVRCHDGRDGEIILSDVSSVAPPVLVSLNGGAFRSQVAFKGLPPGDYLIVLQDANGCEWAAPPVVLPNPPQLAEPLPPYFEVSLGEPVSVQLTLLVDAHYISQITWTPLMDSSGFNQPFQHYSPDRSHYLRVVATDTLGCRFESETLIRVDKRRRVFVPNAIAPGSAANNRLTVFADAGVLLVERMEIFDRWGNLLFQRSDFAPNDPSLGWNGMTRGQAAAPGVYVYQIRIRFVDGETELFSGDFSVIR